MSQHHRDGHRKSDGTKPKLGSGERFAALSASLAKKPGIRNPGAVAASIGRKKYGAKRFASLAAHGTPGY